MRCMLKYTSDEQIIRTLLFHIGVDEILLFAFIERLLLLRLNLLLDSSSFSSTYARNVCSFFKRELSGEGISFSSSFSGLCLMKLRTILTKWIKRATRQAIPQTRNIPQKLCTLSCSESPDWDPCGLLQLDLESHLSWILWSSPVSDRPRIAVDMSTAKGESLGNAF